MITYIQSRIHDREPLYYVLWNTWHKISYIHACTYTYMHACMHAHTHTIQRIDEIYRLLGGSPLVVPDSSWFDLMTIYSTPGIYKTTIYSDFKT